MLRRSCGRTAPQTTAAHWQRAAISLISVGLFLCASVAAAATDKSKAHAACTALRALADLDKSENELLQREAEDVESAASRGFSPIAVGETLNAVVALHLEGSVAALRHALAAGALVEAAELAEFSALDGQLNAMLTASMKEPLFYWHGPRRLIMPRLQQLLRREGVHQRLKSAATNCKELKGEAESLVGSGAPAADKVHPEALEHGLPRLGFAVGGRDGCDAGESYDIKHLLREVGGFNAAGKAHVMVLPSNEKALAKIGAALRDATDAYVSLLIPPHIVGGEQVLLLEAVKGALEDLGRKRLDFLWLPYAAFPKAVWSKVQTQLQGALNEGLIGAYGVQADIGDVRKAKGLFEDRQPAPVAWLTHHDLLQPAHADAAAVARKLGMAIIALPRTTALMHSVSTAYLEVVAGKDSEEMAAHHRWVLQRGFGLVVSISSGEEAVSLQGVVRQLPGTTLSEAGLRLLDNVQLLSRPQAASGETAGEHDGALGLVQNLQQWRRKAAELSMAEHENTDILTSSAATFVPGVTSSMLDNLQEQAREFKANNKVIYRRNFFDEPTFAAIVKEAARLWKSTDVEGNCNLDGRNRVGGYVLDHTSKDSSLYKLIYGNEPFRRWVTGVNDEGPMWPSDFPIELREYPAESHGMGCHPDLQMYAVAKKDLEFAITVDNYSKCNVTYYDKQNKKYEVHPTGNSVMMVGVNAAPHCVSRTDGGHRTILKFIYAGDFRKSKSFVDYKGNECGPENPNNKVLKARRESKDVDRSLEL